MSTAKREDVTYELIINTAKRLFFNEGKFNATTQEIADAAGVNRTLINYYFRSRDALFDLIFKEAKEEENKKQEMIVLSDLPVKEKLEQFIDYFFENAREYPYKEIYIVTRMNQQDSFIFQSSAHIKRMLNKFYVELEDEMEKGTILKMDPIQFVLNLISLLSFPVGMRPLLQQALELSDQEYENILSQRKEIILKTLFKS